MNHNLLESPVLQHNRKTVLATSVVIKTLFEYSSFLPTSVCALRCHTAVCTVSWVEVFSGQSRQKSKFMGSWEVQYTSYYHFVDVIAKGKEASLVS